MIQVDYMNRSCQLGDNELGIGTSTRMLLCEPDSADEYIGTTIEKRFYTSVRLFYECGVTKMLAKFPFKDSTLKDLSLLDPRNRLEINVSSSLNLAKRFCYYNCDELDLLTMEIGDFKVVVMTNFLHSIHMM